MTKRQLKANSAQQCGLMHKLSFSKVYSSCSTHSQLATFWMNKITPLLLVLKLLIKIEQGQLGSFAGKSWQLRERRGAPGQGAPPPTDRAQPAQGAPAWSGRLPRLCHVTFSSHVNALRPVWNSNWSPSPQLVSTITVPGLCENTEVSTNTF